jgi:glycosyltransferase involved in cell wall biosynthesis
MSQAPRISIVVPVRNGVRYLGLALASLAEDDYPDLEVIIQDGGSTDGSLEAARKAESGSPGRFRVFVESDSGMGDALNRGFARATGEIHGCVGSNDLLLPGAVRAAAERISAAARRFVVLGGSLAMVEGVDGFAVERPAEFPGRFGHLAIWNRRFKATGFPALFWHRRVREDLGPFIDGPPYGVDYDFVCRIASRYPIETVRENWSATHLHAGSASGSTTDLEMLSAWVAIGRRHWGTPLSPTWWRLAASYWRHEHEWHERARHHARRSEDAAAQGRPFLAWSERLRTSFFSREMGLHRFGIAYRRLLDRKS